MADILITGGPVHAKLDAVKVVTNRFRGGRMAMLADQLALRGHHVTYLCSKASKRPMEAERNVDVVLHDGFTSYMDSVLALAPRNRLAVLGAAVANLVPEPKEWALDEKFPSHDYEEGDLVLVPFRVAPRIINMVREAAPKTALVGYKLLQGVTDGELLRAAEKTLVDAKADLVIANDADGLDRKLVVTACGGHFEVFNPRRLEWVLDQLALDRWFHTEVIGRDIRSMRNIPPTDEQLRKATEKYHAIMEAHRDELSSVLGGLFGCLAVRVEGTGGLLCSPRGKKNPHDEPVYVYGANIPPIDNIGVHDGPTARHRERAVRTMNGLATLNAPLLLRLIDSEVPYWHLADVILHTHEDPGEWPQEYAPPGTVRDSEREIPDGPLGIAGHGLFRVLR